ncbi:hypothetical protein [Autumnicola psychrophila]|uniref:O-antigen ligase domain-containing protein n=1 Tax=Autumnicola psychrophila TaxID=3075592 RepID=A0ABU3DQR1_9FLAO|nr:hypothetical protein [Zunongwangia sp. F225]MDT0686056.1 hypothetical protein [Zunongwangia sp. F225]
MPQKNIYSVEKVPESFLKNNNLNKSITVESSSVWLKRGVWLYFLLLIFEGALRKWILPGLSAPLLVVRDPLAILIIASAWNKNLLPPNKYMSSMIVVCVIATITALTIGHGSISVAAYGARILLIHFPLIFAIGEIFSRGDVVKIGKVMLWISIPVVILTAMQFYSPQSSWVNRGVGGDMEGSGFSGALGFFRPSGTFSFTTGNTLFFSFLACFVLFFWVSNEKVNKIILIAATTALLASIPFSISRTLFFSIVVSLFFTLIAVSRDPKYLVRMLLATIFLVLMITLLSHTESIGTAINAFTHRFETAGKIEGGVAGSILNRYLGGLIDAITNTDNLPFFGFGIGMGTNAGSAMLTGDRAFLIAEEEWGRLIGEMGIALGILTILIRLAFSFSLTLKSYKKIENGDLLPWILLSFALLIIPQGQWAQPTALGFSTLVGGLILAIVSTKENLFLRNE